MLLQKIMEWAGTQQPWISDAVRRLFQVGQLSQQDIEDLTALVKSSVGIEDSDNRSPFPIDANMVPVPPAAGAVTVLRAMRNLAGVNTIAPNQAISFAELGITIVYGDNGAGKSGYSRVLRKSCRARVSGGPILHDVFAGAPMVVPQAEFEFQQGEQPPEIFQWQEGRSSHEALSRLAVFDSLCARAYNDAESEVAFVPYGLDVMTGLANACGTIRGRIQQELNSTRADVTEINDLMDKTEVGRHLSSFTQDYENPAYIQRILVLAQLNEAELAELTWIATQLKEVDPAAKAGVLRRTKSRIEGLATIWGRVEAALYDGEITKALNTVNEWVAADSASKIAINNLMAGEALLPGTGSDEWKLLFEAARKFSIEQAYSDHVFPHTDNAHCVLCQQPLQDGGPRLQRFEAFIQQATEKEVARLGVQVKAISDAFERATPETLVSDATLLAEITEHQPDLIPVLQNTATVLVQRKQWVLNALKCLTWEAGFAWPGSPIPALGQLALRLEEQAKAFDQIALGDERARIERRQAELTARQRLGTRCAAVLNLAARMTLRRKLIEAYQATDTSAISRRINALHQEAVSTGLEAAFARECEALGVSHLRVRNHTRTDRGTAKQQIKLNIPGKNKVGEVLSEGEQRTLALASFMAEVSLVSGHAGIIFDDPMSSLDHLHRERVAQRLAQEGRVRQVIVFTHDLTFANHLVEASAECQTTVSAMSIRRINGHAGIVFPELPFAGKRVRERLEKIRGMAVRAREALNRRDHDQHELLIRQAYGRLRETWERLVEEIVLHQTIVRFRPGVETQRLKGVVIDDVLCD